MSRPALIKEVMHRLESGDPRATALRSQLYREMAAKGGQTKTPRRAAASRKNGAAGGRPSQERIEKANALLAKLKTLKNGSEEKVAAWMDFMECATRAMVRAAWTSDLPRPEWL
jgi:hypothetical protein